jgi:hypothetical protein
MNRMTFGIPVLFLACSCFSSLLGQSMGPLTVHPDNPRYFTNDGKQAVYLTGSHTWAGLHERGYAGVTPDFDYPGYLDFLEANNHNFIRLWAWEQAHWMQFTPEKIRYTPLRYQRTGPGLALDGYPKFDVTQFEQYFFDRLRNRVRAAQDRGIYVMVMLFQGFSVHQKGSFGPPSEKNNGNNWAGHPFNRANNINGIDGDPDNDDRGREVHSLQIPEITKIQERFVRKVIDTLNDLDNVLWEIGNECDNLSTEWQYHLIRLIQDYEATKPKQHPVAMTFQYGAGDRRGTNAALFNSPAEAISPAMEDGQNYQHDPPVADGSKVILSDTDHHGGLWGTVEWVWKSFLRGHYPIMMDAYTDVRRSSWSVRLEGGPPDAYWNGARLAMGDTRRFAERVHLADMTPRNELASSGYCLANPGIEYLVLVPGEDTVTLDLTTETGTFTVEWYLIHGRRLLDKTRTLQGGEIATLKSLKGEDAVVYIFKKN